MHRNKHLAIFLLTSITTLLLDQLTKTLVASHLKLYESIPIINGFFNITFVTNTGAAFSLFANGGNLANYLLLLTSLIIVSFLIYLFLSTTKHMIKTLSLSLIIGGAFGNIIDRIRLGRVIDFLDFYIGPYHWPAFNIADSAITIGAVMFAYYLIKFEKN